MSRTSRNILKSYFERGDTPTAEQFAQLIDALLHQDDDGLFAKDGQRIGIGTDTPQNRLDVKGSLVVGHPLAGQAQAPLNGAHIAGELKVGSEESPAQLTLNDTHSVRGISDDEHLQEDSDRLLATQKAIRAYVQGQVNEWKAQLVGSVSAFAMHTPPPGWLECNGQAVSREAYPTLFRRIGGIYGVGNGATTFNVPDLRGEFVRGWDHGRGVDGGRPMGTWQQHQFQSHNHSISTRQDDWNVSGGTGPSYGADNGAYLARYSTGHMGGHETRPRNVALLYCIKY
ncbi:MAG TPA: hypothetical protein DCR93_37115 [Cytophagales bacterium]|nr:hypothetical protein [Cytophagales bacterium]